MADQPASGFRIPEELAKRHASPQPGETAADSARRLGAGWATTFVDFGGLHGDARVLDIGCGPGRMAIAIGERFGWSNAYLGFDIAKADIEFCASTITPVHPAFRFVHLDVRNHYYNPRGKQAPERVVFPAADASADFVFATSVFTHFFTAETRRYLREAYRCMAPGATLLATFFLLDAEARAGIAAEKARMDFPHRVDERAFALSKQEPAKAVAYELAFVLDEMAACGFTDVVHHRGSWGGVAGRHSQDVLVAKRR